MIGNIDTKILKILPMDFQIESHLKLFILILQERNLFKILQVLVCEKISNLLLLSQSHNFGTRRYSTNNPHF